MTNGNLFLKKSMLNLALLMSIFIFGLMCEAAVTINQLVNRIAKEMPDNTNFPFASELPGTICTSNEKKVSDRTVYLLYFFQERSGYTDEYVLNENHLFIRKPKKDKMLHFRFDWTTKTKQTNAFTLWPADAQNSLCKKGTLLTQRTFSDQKNFGFFELTSSEVNEFDSYCIGMEHDFDSIQTTGQQALTCYF